MFILYANEFSVGKNENSRAGLLAWFKLEISQYGFGFLEAPTTKNDEKLFKKLGVTANV